MDEIISKLVEGSSERQIDPALKDLLTPLIGCTPEEQKQGFHKALDYAARYSLCSGFTMAVMDACWKQLGGTPNDPTPWREDMK